MPFNQDDARERAMVAALNLQQDVGRVRHDADAYLELEVKDYSHHLDFECKSAPVQSDFGTGRDTGMRQLVRWSTMHFVFGWFEPRDNQPVRMWYGSPEMMRDWNLRERDYLRPDLNLVGSVPLSVDDNVFSEILGEVEVFTYAQLKAIVKDQWNANSAAGRPNLYQARADIVRTGPTAGLRYSRRVAEAAVRERVSYLLTRGSTVNNRKISRSYVMENCVEIKPPRWAASLTTEIEAALHA